MEAVRRDVKVAERGGRNAGNFKEKENILIDGIS